MGGLQHAEGLTLGLGDRRRAALGQNVGDDAARDRSGAAVHHDSQALVSGPVTGSNTLAAWLIQSLKAGALGKRAEADCVSRNSDDAPPRQLGLAGRPRRGAVVMLVRAVRFSGMATTSFVCSVRALLFEWRRGCCAHTSATSVPRC
jgi:hypothetical protein